MNEGDYIAAWLAEPAAKLLLGLQEQTPGHRWCALGFLKRELHVGFWLEVEAVQERRPGDNRIVQAWTVKPRTCFIRWDFVSHMQLWGTPVPDKREIGFFATKVPE